MRLSNHLLTFVDRCGECNRDRNIWVYWRTILYRTILVYLKKHYCLDWSRRNKVCPDTEFGLMWRKSAQTDSKTVAMFDLWLNFCKKSNQNECVVLFHESSKEWDRNLRFLPVCSISKQNISQYEYFEDTVFTRTRTGCNGPHTEQGTNAAVKPKMKEDTSRKCI